jgi:integrase
LAFCRLEEIADVPDLRDKCSQFVFPGRHGPLSRSAVAELVPPGATIHGFRSSFRDWCGEETSFPRDLAEACLAHVSGDATERAYRRGDALEKRRMLMEEWAQHCAGISVDKVVHLRRQAASDGH